MPVPKRKRSKSRRDKRHANWGLEVKPFSMCKQCAHPLPGHQACGECGYYKGAKVLRTKDDRAHDRGESRKVKEATKAKKEPQENKEGTN